MTREDGTDADAPPSMGAGGFTFEPIGFVRSSLTEAAAAPRQPTRGGAEARVELLRGKGYEDALDGLEGFSHVWLLFVFHRALAGTVRKVQPPRSTGPKIGVFATRSPHRPNPIGMSVVELVRVDGLALVVRGADLLDGTPILDVKPYVAYADAVGDAAAGWLASDPKPAWRVSYRVAAEGALAWLAERGVDLRGDIDARLGLGPQPHAYRRITLAAPGSDGTQAGVLALKDWRVQFSAHEAERAIEVTAIATGYRPSQLAAGRAPELHQRFVAFLAG